VRNPLGSTVSTAMHSSFGKRPRSPLSSHLGASSRLTSPRLAAPAALPGTTVQHNMPRRPPPPQPAASAAPGAIVVAAAAPAPSQCEDCWAKVPRVRKSANYALGMCDPVPYYCPLACRLCRRRFQLPSVVLRVRGAVRGVPSICTHQEGVLGELHNGLLKTLRPFKSDHQARFVDVAASTIRGDQI
jgi:hypothetical protein